MQASERADGAKSGLEIRLMGELELRLGDGVLPRLESGRAESLLAYLMLRRGAPLARHHVAFRLWPESTEAQAKTNLRHVLHTLRHALPNPDELVEITARTLTWRADAPVRVDLDQFHEALRRSEETDGDERCNILEAAVALYRGDLLEGFYEEWLSEPREQLRQRYLGALERLVRVEADRGRTLRAIAWAERLLRSDPLREETYRTLMELHADGSDRARALRIYHQCAATFERELGVEPSALTRALYERLLPPASSDLRSSKATRVHDPALVGRESEFARMMQAWHRAAGGSARMLLIAGEAGIGKTRLLQALRSAVVTGPTIALEARSYAAEGALAYGALVDWLRSDALAVRRNRLEPSTIAELARILPELAHNPDEGGGTAARDRQRRQRLFAAAARTIGASASPLLLVLEDAQWCDRETLQFVHYLIRSAPAARLLVVGTLRTGEGEPDPVLTEVVNALRAFERLETIDVPRLTVAQTASLAASVLGRSVSPQQAERLFAETHGNPLFAIEVLRAGWPPAEGVRPAITPKLQSTIEARLARLSPLARELSELAAAVGTAFTPQLLGAATRTSPGSLLVALDELWRRGIVMQHGADGYDFTHETIRDVAYATLGPAGRSRLHLSIAGALARRRGARPDHQATRDIAFHYDRAGFTSEAVGWYVRAAAEARRRYAGGDVVRLLQQALALIATLPREPDRDVRELEVLIMLLPPLLAVAGSASPALTRAQERALELGREHGLPAAPALLRSIALTSMAMADFAKARATGEQCNCAATKTPTTSCWWRATTSWESARSGKAISTPRADISKRPWRAAAPLTERRTSPNMASIRRSRVSAGWR